MIGWYVHHHGRGHATRAAVIAAALDEPVIVLSSAPRPADGDVFADWVELATDDDLPAIDDPADPDRYDVDPYDIDAHGRLHWVPVGSPGLAARSAQLTSWLDANRPRVMVVDVSVEVTVLARLCGVRVVVVAGPGDRDDAAHQLAYDLAERIVVPWPREIYDPPYLHRHAAKCVYVGALSRFDDVDDERRAQSGHGVFVLNGAGGTTLTADQVDVAARHTDVPWTSAGLPGQDWSAGVWDDLVASSVTVTHAGQNALAEVAAARRPAVVIAQDRPFGEQHRVSAALHRHGLAVTLDRWPDATQWPAILAAACQLGGNDWARWNPRGGAARAAEAISAVGRP